MDVLPYMEYFFTNFVSKRFLKKTSQESTDGRVQMAEYRWQSTDGRVQMAEYR